MPTQEVAFLSDPATLLAGGDGERLVLLDGRSADSWGDGTVVFAAAPTAVLEIDAATEVDPMDALQSFVDANLENGSAGIFFALSYDLKHAVENLGRRLPWPRCPLLYAAAYDWAYRGNRRSGSASIVAGSDAAAARGRQRLQRPAEGLGDVGPLLQRPEPLMTPPEYRAMVEAAREYIRAGDIYQANLAQAFRFRARPGDGPAVFARWTSRYPNPFAAYVDGGSWSLLSNSPECFLRVRGRVIETYPIKGTRAVEPGGDTAAIAAELAADPKERAEHLMIVDLERNDLGRLCETGSVHVPELQRVREYPMLTHMVSKVRGRLRPRVALADIVRATFPGGSITGAPKIRAMQIIEELEPLPRGFYTGSLGWIEPNRDVVSSIAIRTGFLDREGLSFHAGGGIVADSDPEREYCETHAKLQSLFRVLSGEGMDRSE